MSTNTIPPAAEVRKPVRLGNNGGGGNTRSTAVPFNLESARGVLVSAVILLTAFAVGLAMMAPPEVPV